MSGRILCRQCHGELTHMATVERDSQVYFYYMCPGCRRCTHRVEYAYTPDLCPKHQHEFMGTEFQERPGVHEIWHVFRCDRCGDVHKVPRHTTAAGISGRIELEDPRVSSTILVNRSVVKTLGTPELKEIVPPDMLADRVALIQETFL